MLYTNELVSVCTRKKICGSYFCMATLSSYSAMTVVVKIIYNLMKWKKEHCCQLQQTPVHKSFFFSLHMSFIFCKLWRALHVFTWTIVVRWSLLEQCDSRNGFHNVMATIEFVRYINGFDWEHWFWWKEFDFDAFLE